MNIKKSRITALIIFVGLLAMAAAVACGGGDPEELDLPVRIQGGVMTPETIEAKQGDMVTLKIQADEAGEFHLHTYDIEADIDAAEETDFYFVADATGRFKITYHHIVEAGHGDIFESVELAPGDTFSYRVDDHLAGETVPFHSQLRAAFAGTIHVSQESGRTTDVAIEYGETAANPSEVHVGPGTVITWTNNSSVPQTVVSGLHADMEGGEEEEHQESAHDDEAIEFEIGFLEVQPR